MRGNADSFDSTGLTEEVKQTVLLGMEAQVADKQSRRFACGARSPTRLVATSRLLTELDPDLPSVQRALIRGSKCRLGLLMRLELDESFALVVQELTFGQRAIRLIVAFDAFIGRVE